MFVRKRDPRYKAHLKAQSLPPPLPDRNARQVGEEPAVVYVEQEWQKNGLLGVEDLEWALAEGNDDPDVFECVPCGKSFKSEAAWSSHERSKKHMKNVEVLRRQMMEEAMQLDLPVDPGNESGPELAEGSKQSGGPATPLVDDGSDEGHGTPNVTETPPEPQAQMISAEETLPKGAEETGQVLPQEQKSSKRDKRRLREAKKQAQAVEDAHVSD